MSNNPQKKTDQIDQPDFFYFICFWFDFPSLLQLDPAGWMPKCFVNRLNNKLVMIIENLKKLAQACPIDGDDT